ncbi:pantoate--beta-alanine ligase [Gillisia sp. M10.2A]|uniref:Pantothenate synthetase n=1 Tax=Gillisia lutea TaxID=2909668 RepID=A0ABS9EC76_9FLAO|nr:pantoate--beta-alanine ligase [Gillisia lutea]MCF4100478.1 pantoate--beta-alanine ligase [Gillisia lutea]
MQIFKEKGALQSVITALKEDKSVIGFVPTMGALHEGHLSLVKQAANSCDVVVVSIFINPTQFDKDSDLKNYPRTLESDLNLLKELNLNILVFTPNAEELYDGKITAEHFDFDGIEYEMEGKYRTGHFDGVGTIVKKLFEIVQPNFAFFGEKDFQQLQIIRKLTQKHKLPVEVVGCEIQRESNGLARSSRNERLKAEERENASFIYQILKKANMKFGTESAKEISEWVKKEFQTHPFLKLEYFEIANSHTLKTVIDKESGTPYRAFIAAYAGDVRLIDNMALNN